MVSTGRFRFSGLSERYWGWELRSGNSASPFSWPTRRQTKEFSHGRHGGLSTAFDTTLLGLVASIVVQMLMTFRKRQEFLLLDECTSIAKPMFGQIEVREKAEEGDDPFL